MCERDFPQLRPAALRVPTCTLSTRGLQPSGPFTLEADLSCVHRVALPTRPHNSPLRGIHMDSQTHKVLLRPPASIVFSPTWIRVVTCGCYSKLFTHHSQAKLGEPYDLSCKIVAPAFSCHLRLPVTCLLRLNQPELLAALLPSHCFGLVAFTHLWAC